MTPADERNFWMHVRQMLLGLVDAIERYKVKIRPRTSELRKERKQGVE